VVFMVKEVYACEICGLVYADKALAEKCERFCGEHKSCDLTIIKQAIGKLKEKA